MAKKSKVYPGAIFESKSCGKFKIIELDHEDVRNNPSGVKRVKFYKVQFLDTGYEDVFECSTILKGDVKDNLCKSIVGVASFGYGKQHKNHNEVIYRNYHTLIRRIYDPNCSEYKRYGKLGVTISDRWLRYDYFLDDLDSIPGFDLKLYTEGKIQLDKDILQPNTPINKKVYSKDTCMFVSPSENAAEANNRRHDEAKKKIRYKKLEDSEYETYTGSILGLSKELGISPSSIGRCIKGEYEQSNGYTFEIVN